MGFSRLDASYCNSKEALTLQCVGVGMSSHCMTPLSSKWQEITWTPLNNTLRPRQYGRRFADHKLKCIFLNENIWILINDSMNFIPKGLINNIPALVQIMAWCRAVDRPLSEPMVVSLLAHICVTRPQRANVRNTHVCVRNIAVSLRWMYDAICSTVMIICTSRAWHIATGNYFHVRRPILTLSNCLVYKQHSTKASTLHM